MDLNDLTIGQAKQLVRMFPQTTEYLQTKQTHPMLGKRCIVRTYSAGVHFGTVTYINGTEIQLNNAYRLWEWKNGGLSLSAVNQNGLKGGRINYTGEIYLINAIELMPMTVAFEASYGQYVEDRK